MANTFRRVVIAGAITVLGAAGSSWVEAAAPSSAGRPVVVVTDPAGDAGPLAGNRHDLAAHGSEASYDVLKLAFGMVRENGIPVLKAALTLSGAPTDSAAYLVTFDVPGCVGVPPFGGVPLPSVTPPGFDAATEQGGVLLYLDRSFHPARSDSYISCRGTGDLQSRSEEMTYTVSGNTITMSVPVNEIIRPGAVLKAPAVFTSARVGGRDSTKAGADYTVPALRGSNRPVGPQMRDQKGDVPDPGADVVSLTFARKTAAGKPVLATLVETAAPLAPGLGVRIAFDLPTCTNGSGSGAVAHLAYGAAGQQASVVCQLTGQTDVGTFAIRGTILEMQFPVGLTSLLRRGAVIRRATATTEGPGEATIYAFGIDRTFAGRPYTI